MGVLDRGAGGGLPRYAETYCTLFANRGWVYDDGTLSIDAYTKSGREECVAAEPGEAARTVSCKQVESLSEPEILDCALLDLVRRSDVRTYVENLQRRRDVSCDDGTPLDRVGAT